MFRLIHYSIVLKPYVGIHKKKTAKNIINIWTKLKLCSNRKHFIAAELNASTLGKVLMPMLIRLVTSNIGCEPDGPNRAFLNWQVLGWKEYF